MLLVSHPKLPSHSYRAIVGGFQRGVFARGEKRLGLGSFSCLKNVRSRLFPDFLAPRGDPARLFQTLFGFRARRARETPVACRRVCNTIVYKCAHTWGLFGPLCKGNSLYAGKFGHFQTSYGLHAGHLPSGFKMTGVSKASRLNFVVFARFLALTAKDRQVNDHHKGKN